MSQQKHTISQNQSLKQKLSHQNIQLFKMMELNILQFNERVQEELDLNPAIENLDTNGDDLLNLPSSDVSENDFENENSNELEINDLDNSEDSFSDFKIKENQIEYDYSNDEDEKDYYIPIVDNDSLVSNLINQLKYNNLSPIELAIGEYIIGDLDDDGYLRRTIENIVDDLAFRQNIEVDEATIQKVIEYIQDLEPAGIGARNLQECLLIQLYKKTNNKLTNFAITVIQDYFDDYSKKNFIRIKKKLHITDEEFEEINKLILSLNPKPTYKNVHDNELGKFIIPDFFIYRNDKKLELELHSYNQPNLAISEDFVEMLKKNKEIKKKTKQDKDVQNFLSEKINLASTFISMIKERQETMVIIMKIIMDIQYEFFMSGNEIDIKPMALKNISLLTNFDISTISRSTSNKYVQTEFGIFSLKFLFSESITNDSGDEVSTRKIMKTLESLIESEDKSKPKSDDVLTKELEDLGFKIARRTTAKYRENLNIPPKHLRKI